MDEPSEHRQGGELLAALSRALVTLQKEFGGKGPTETETYWVGEDMLVVVMGGGYTAAEETLYQGGQGIAVRDARHAFQDVMEERLSELIHRLTGREVIAFMSASHQSPDLTADLFVLAPTTPESPSG